MLGSNVGTVGLFMGTTISIYLGKLNQVRKKFLIFIVHASYAFNNCLKIKSGWFIKITGEN